MGDQQKAEAVDTAIRTLRDVLRATRQHHNLLMSNHVNTIVQNADASVKATLWDLIMQQAAEHEVQLRVA